MNNTSGFATSQEVAEVIAKYVQFDDAKEMLRYGIQALVAQPQVFNFLAKKLTEKAIEACSFDFVTGNVVGGMVLGWQMAQYAGDSLREVPFVYVREGFKQGGHRELEVGTRNNPLIRTGMSTLLVDIEEDGDKYEQRIKNSKVGLESAGYRVSGIVTIAEPRSLAVDVDQIHLVTVAEVVESAKQGRTRGIEVKAQDKPNYRKAPLDDIGLFIMDGGALEIRDVDGGEEPFLYSSGHRGPGYLMIKGLVGQPSKMKYLVRQLALRVLEQEYDVDVIAANATGGVVPGWQLRSELELLTGREIPYVCVTGTRVNLDEADPHEVTIGTDSPLVTPGMNMLVVEELVNFAETTTTSARLLRKAGFNVRHAATLFSYDHAKQHQTLSDYDVELTALITLQQQLDIAEERFEPQLVTSYREFLVDPVGWQERRGITPPTKDAR